jgi:predicted homoserine dehydrogenase-like protein
MDGALAQLGSALTAALVGVGEFGASFLYRSGRARGLRVVAAADADIHRVVGAAQRAGFPDDRIALCATAASVRAAFDRGDFVAVEDASLFIAERFDVVVEATGAPAPAATIAAAAIANGKHVALVTKECDSVVGAALQARARSAGVVCAPVDGDQPSLAIGLVQWARALGFEIVCAGKAGEYDFVHDVRAGTIAAIGKRVPAPWLDATWAGPASSLADRVMERARELRDWPHRTVPDLCELAIVANATGLRPDRAQLHAPIARTLELPDLMRPSADGGLLSRAGAVDMFNCLRRSDEMSFAGGVFVVVRCDDAATWQVLNGKGIPTSEDLRHALLHNPVHLLGMEAPMSVRRMVAAPDACPRLVPRCDLHARALRPLRAGSELALGARHTIEGVEPLLHDAVPARGNGPLPYYMAAGCRLRKDVAEGELLRREHVVVPDDSVLWRLRDEQDALIEARDG